MISLDREIQQALWDDPEVSSAVGRKVFRYSVGRSVSQNNDYPYVRIVEVDNYDSDYEDDQPSTSHIFMQIDVWDVNPPDALLTSINKVMVKKLGFTRANVRTSYDMDKSEIRKIMRYQIKT